MIPRTANSQIAKWYKRIPNTTTYETTYVEFRAKVSNTKDNGSFFALNGVIVENASLTLYVEDFDVSEIRPNDRVIFMGNDYLVQSVGVYLNRSRAYSNYTYNDTELIKRCPKGIQLV